MLMNPRFFALILLLNLAFSCTVYLNGGNLYGKQIVSKEWIERSITPNIEEGHTGIKYRGYQYQWYSDDGQICVTKLNLQRLI